MKTKDRLRKIVRSATLKSGHDLGYFIQNDQFEWKAKCLKCSACVFIYTGKTSLQRMPIARRRKLLEDFANDKVSPSGLTNKEVFSIRSRGSIYGPALDYKCGEVPLNQIEVFDPLSMYEIEES